MHWIRGIATVLVCLASAGHASAHWGPWYLDEVQNPGVDTLGPEQIIDAAALGSAGDIALSADGRQLMYTQPSVALDVWSALVSRWPELVLGVIVLFSLWRMIRTIRRRRRYPIEDGPYCNMCAYPTQGLASEDCPECGKPLADKGTTPGIPRRKAAFATIGWCNLALAGLGLYLNLDYPRYGSLSQAFTWHSESLGRWVKSSKDHYLKPHLRHTIALRSIDIDTLSQPQDIGRVLLSSEHGSYEQISGQMADNPWLFRGEMVYINTPQTFAFISTHVNYARVDLASLTIDRAGKLHDRPVVESREYPDRFSAAGEHTYMLLWPEFSDELMGRGEYVPAWYSQRIDRSDRQLVVYASLSTTPFELSSREAGSLRFTPEGQPIEPVAFVPDEYEIETVQIGPEMFYEFDGGGSVLGRFCAGYLVVLSSETALLYDIEHKRWAVALDMSPMLSDLTSDGLELAIAADRSRVALLKPDGNKVAIYRLPDSPAP